MYEGPINVRYEPDHAAVSFDEDETPFLTWSRHPIHGNGWTLWYLDLTAGVEDHFIPGDIADQADAISAARDWLGRFSVEP